MKKTFLIVLLIISMLTMTGFATVEGSYWEAMKSIYEWDALEGEVEIELTVTNPYGESNKYKVNMYSQTDLKNIIAYMEIKIEGLEELQEIPVIELYTHGTDFYINTEVLSSVLPLMGIVEDLDIEEEYIMLKSSDNNIEINSNILQDAIEFIENMDLDIELGMIQEGNTYTLTLDSDQIIDLLDACIKYYLENMDQLFAIHMEPEMMPTEEELQEILEMYNTFVVPYKEIAKEFIRGSYYHQVSTFEENAYNEEAELIFRSPMIQFDMEMISTSRRLTKFDMELPESVMVITEEELTYLLIGGLTGAPQMELKAIFDMEGDYIKIVEGDLEEGSIEVMLEEGKLYIEVEDIVKLLDIEIEDREGLVWIRELENYGFYVNWNPANNTIEIYQ